MAKAFAVTLIILLGFVGFIIFRTGYFKPVTIASGDQGPFYFVYKVHEGPYHEIAPVIDAVEDTFNQKGIECPLAFGRYLYDPDTTPHDRLVSHGGCVFLSLNPEIEDVIQSEKLTLEQVAKKEYVVAHFEGSPSIGPMKVYPYVEEWLAKYGYQKQETVIELYQTTGEDSLHTRYLFQYK